MERKNNMITKTIGGDRVGSGKKMKAHLHNYERSTHNLSKRWASTMGSGMLIPCYCKPLLRGDSFDISLNADARTIPTKGPLFGSYKMQIDFYQCPIRLYQAILHNNPLNIGLNMKEIMLPKIQVDDVAHEMYGKEAGEFSNNCLLKYLGQSGIGRPSEKGIKTISRNILAVPALAYYDIFKTYYANKQEEKAYVIQGKQKEVEYGMLGDKYLSFITSGNPPATTPEYGEQTPSLQSNNDKLIISFRLRQNEDKVPNDTFTADALEIYDDEDNLLKSYSLQYIIESLWTFKDEGDYRTFNVYDGYIETMTIQMRDIDGDNDFYTRTVSINLTSIAGRYAVLKKVYETYYEQEQEINIVPFNLTNIDDMRYDILSAHTLGTAFKLSSGNHDYLPYNTLFLKDESNVTLNRYPLNGIVLKTYQNDIFNNWLNTDWIEGENGINEITKIGIVDGAFSIDSLNFATKLYNMLNRIALAGATYEDWQDVVYEEANRRQIESPMYLGGMSQEIIFDEIVQNAPAVINGETSELGTLGGRGKVMQDSKKGGKIHVKCDEASFLIGIISLTPRQFYTQGNEFYMTEVDSMDDFHKPPMDGIGFQDLIGERMAWWDTVITVNSATIEHRSKIGKLPAWIEYMTDVDTAYGDFAEKDGKGFMILNRAYEKDEETGGIKDATTYIDPSKYNYAFAYTELQAQNFWVEIAFNITARRKMSARLIPNV